MTKDPLTQARLKLLVSYDKDTGLFTHIKKRNGVTVGKIAGSSDPNGYIRIALDGRDYFAHRLAWFYMMGEWPPFQIDHVNRVTSDNRFCNLRLATNAENHQNCGMPKNNSSGFIGVDFHKPKNKWRATIKVNGKGKHIGYFDTKEAAAAARRAAELELHPFRACPS